MDSQFVVSSGAVGDGFDTGHRGLLEWVAEQDKGTGKSSMWQGLIADFEMSARDENYKDQVFQLNAKRSYNFFYAKHETLAFVIRRLALGANFWLVRAANFLRNKLWKTNIYGLGEGQLAFHPAGLRWLKSVGFYEAYEAFCREYRMSLYCANGIKAFYLASKMKPYISGGSRFIEVGAGLGNLATILIHQNQPTQYVIVDLPEMLLNSAMTLHTLFPERECYFVYPGSTSTYSATQPGIYFCAPECLPQIDNEMFDLGVNVDSFQEMTNKQVELYLSLFQRVIRKGGFIANINRRKYLDAEKFDNNPLMYPYDPRNNILAWEVDLFMDRVFNLNHGRLDGWIWRIEQKFAQYKPPAGIQGQQTGTMECRKI
jgi:ubiquinone/menaquinone biosynthesis C-methylase UbiE